MQIGPVGAASALEPFTLPPVIMRGPHMDSRFHVFGIDIANSNQILESSKPLSGLVNLLPSALAHGVISH